MKFYKIHSVVPKGKGFYIGFIRRYNQKMLDYTYIIGISVHLNNTIYALEVR